MVEARAPVARTIALAFAVLVGLGGCGSERRLEGLEVELSDGTIIETAELVEFDNDRGEALMGVMIRPDATTPEPMPAVVVLHGSGGLFATPDSNDTKLEVAQQFADWAGMLIQRGYAVMLPSSFYSRGYFEWDDHPPGVDETDRLIMRAYDVYGALRYACAQPFIDCARVGLVGFSNGGSTALLAMHERLDEVTGMSSLTPAATRERFVGAFSYYPGCDMQDLVDDPAKPYYPTAMVAIHHASRDPLLEDCPARLDAVQAIAEARRASEVPLSLTIYPGAGHGFDDEPENSAEASAQDQARAATLADLDRMLRP
jgi:dienelactone hydrolase